MIKFEKFSKSYGNFIAVHDVSFWAQKGKATVLLGANGAGKTTLLRACTAMHYASSGNVLVSDNEQDFFFDVAKNTPLAKKLVGYVPENPVLYEDMFVQEFIIASAKLHYVLKDKIYQSVKKVMTQCSLTSVATKKIKTLSKGYKQRVSLAASLVFDPPNIVLDEPASGLDPAQINHLRNIITELSKTKTVLLSTHIISEAIAIEPNIIIISDGTVAVQGSSKTICEIAKTHTLEEAYLHFAGEKR